jgi:hypothetical protein
VSYWLISPKMVRSTPCTQLFIPIAPYDDIPCLKRVLLVVCESFNHYMARSVHQHEPERVIWVLANAGQILPNTNVFSSYLAVNPGEYLIVAVVHYLPHLPMVLRLQSSESPLWHMTSRVTGETPTSYCI